MTRQADRPIGSRALRAPVRLRAALVGGLGLLALAALPAAAAATAPDCLEEAKIRAAAIKLNALETVPLLGSRGTHYLLVVFADHGLVFSTAGACGKTALRLSPHAVKRVLAKSIAH